MKDSQNRTKNQLLKRVWDWIKITSLILGLFCGSILIFQWRNRKQKLARLEVHLQELKSQAQRQFNVINFS